MEEKTTSHCVLPVTICSRETPVLAWKLHPIPWPNVSVTKEMLDFLTKKYDSGRPQGKFYVTQGILTPGAWCVAKHPKGSLQDTLSANCSKPFVDWLKTKKAGANGINICIMDFVEANNYITTVIALNNTL